MVYLDRDASLLNINKASEWCDIKFSYDFRKIGSGNL